MVRLNRLSRPINPLHLYRRLLREATYLPPPIRPTISQQIEQRFRRTRDWVVRKAVPPDKQQRYVARGLVALSRLHGANHRDIGPMRDLVRRAFGRRGPLRRQYLDRYLLHPNATPTKQVLPISGPSNQRRPPATFIGSEDPQSGPLAPPDSEPAALLASSVAANDFLGYVSAVRQITAIREPGRESVHRAGVRLDHSPLRYSPADSPHAQAVAAAAAAAEIAAAAVAEAEALAAAEAAMEAELEAAMQSEPEAVADSLLGGMNFRRTKIFGKVQPPRQSISIHSPRFPVVTLAETEAEVGIEADPEVEQAAVTSAEAKIAAEPNPEAVENTHQKVLDLFHTTYIGGAADAAATVEPEADATDTVKAAKTAGVEAEATGAAGAETVAQSEPAIVSPFQRAMDLLHTKNIDGPHPSPSRPPKPAWYDTWDVDGLAKYVKSQNRHAWRPMQIKWPLQKPTRADFIPDADADKSQTQKHPAWRRLSKHAAEAAALTMPPLPIDQFERLRSLSDTPRTGPEWHIPARRTPVAPPADEAPAPAWDWRPYAMLPLRVLEHDRAPRNLRMSGERDIGPYGRQRFTARPRKKWVQRVYKSVYTASSIVRHQDGKLTDIGWGSRIVRPRACTPQEAVLFRGAGGLGPPGQGQPSRQHTEPNAAEGVKMK